MEKTGGTMTTGSSGVKIAAIYGGTVAYGDVVYLANSGKWVRATANSESTSVSDLGIALSAGAVDESGTVLKLGYVENPVWSWTVGTPVYLSPITPGALTQTRPSGTGTVLRIVGYPATTTTVYVAPGVPHTLATVEGLTPDAGDLIVGEAGAWAKKTIGTTGQVLTSTGTGVDWQTPDLPTQVIGVEWDASSSSPTLTHIDANGNATTPGVGYFDAHPVFGGRWRCVRDRATGEITYGTNARGDGLTLDGSAGDVLVREPIFYVRYQALPHLKRYRWWVSPTPAPGFEVHPHFNQRGNGSGATSLMYCGAYEGSFRVKSDDNTLYLASATGRQPWTGGSGVSDGIFRLGFSGGTGSEPTIGQTVAGATSGQQGIVEGVYTASGTWGADAAGIIYLSRPSSVTRNAVFTDAEALQVGAVTFASVAAATANANYAVDMDDLESFGNNLSKGAGVGNPWSVPARQLLMYIEYGTFDLQTALGKGIVDKSSGTGFAGELTGADSADTNIGTNGTGTGTGTNGTTPVVWRGIENPWGNIWEYLIGMLVTTDGAGTYRITKRDGSGSDTDGKLTETPGAGTFESGTGLVQAASSGWVYPVSLVSDALGCLMFAPDNSDHSAGSTSGYLCDGWYASTSSNRILLAGGRWSYGLYAGPGFRNATYAVATSDRTVGARLEFRPGVV
jgi:hypothetical protein